MTRSARLFLGLITIWPLVYLVLFAATIATIVLSGGVHLAELPRWPGYVLAMQPATLALTGGLVCFYVIRVFSSRLARDQRARWVVALVLGSVFAMPVFFWRYVWPEKKHGARG
jgi:hypothetical protein